MGMKFLFRWQLMVGIIFLGSTLFGQPIVPAHVDTFLPQSRPLPMGITDRNNSVQVIEVRAKILLTDQAAETALEIQLQNNSNIRREGVVVLPAPAGAVVRGFSFDGSGVEPSAQLLPAEKARRLYNQIVAQTRDPALLEFIGYNLIRSSVFPIAPHGTQTIRLTYEHVMPVDGKRYDYILPRSESLENNVPWDIQVDIKSEQLISTVYSASHSLRLKRLSPSHLTATVKPSSRTDPGSFRLSCLLENEPVSASLMCYPDPTVGGGYFLLLAGLPAELSQQERTAIRRELTLVIDRSGSMRGTKIEQTREAACQIIDALNTDDTFNVMAFQNVVEPFSTMPQRAHRKQVKAAWDYIEAITPLGGTNIYDALYEALHQKPQGDRLGLVLFLTDGRPTVGKTREADIRALAADYNPYQRRVFTFGVGTDVNAPLLDKIAELTRGSSCYVLEDEDIEAKVGQVYKRLAGPIMAEPVLSIRANKTSPAAPRALDVLPHDLGDLFDGDQLVILGKYQGDQPLTFELKGNYLGQRKTFRWKFSVDQATTRNAFIPRLWAARKIAELIDTIRQQGADTPPNHPNPTTQELIDEIVRLSTEFGILTEYTSFLARDGARPNTPAAMRFETERRVEDRAVVTRWGKGGVNQSLNLGEQKKMDTLNYRNRYLDENMDSVAFNSVQQMNDRAYFNSRGKWLEGELSSQAEIPVADQEIQFGSDSYFQLAQTLAQQNRQGIMTLRGDIILKLNGQVILVHNPQ